MISSGLWSSRDCGSRSVWIRSRIPATRQCAVVEFTFVHMQPDEIRPLQCPWLRGFKSWCDQGIRQTRRWSDDTKEHRFYPGSGPLAGKDLHPACLTLLLGCLQRWCLQRWRRLDLAEGVELSRIRALGWMMEKVSRGRSWISLPTFYMWRLGLRIALQVNYW
jgi:hypothetical protein